VSSPQITRAIPIAFVADVDASAVFYRNVLGFTIDFLHGEPPFYGSISRGGACIHLKFVHQPVLTVSTDDRDDFITVFIEVDDVQSLFAEYVDTGAAFVHRLRTEPWGGLTFIVKDPDGNALCFAGAPNTPA